MITGTAEKFGKLDILFNNAGYEGPTMCPEPTGFPSIEDDTMLAINNINMTGPLLCAKYAIAEMQKNGPEVGGIIIGNSSVGECMPAETANFLPIYHPTKAYMGALTRSIAATHAMTGIKAYNVNPGPVMTDMWTKVWETLPAYALPIVESMGATDAESFANLSIAYANGPGLLYSADIAKVVLAFTNGTTLYKPGDSVCTYPGCTYHVSELYGGIFGGMAALSAEYLKTKMKDHLGNILFGEEAGTTTVTTTTKKKDGSSTTTTVTTTVE